LYCVQKKKEVPLTGTWVDNATLPEWLDDKSQKDCDGCAESVGHGNMHNCRLCGFLFCERCADKTMPIAERFLQKGGKNPQRTCVECQYIYTKLDGLATIGKLPLEDVPKDTPIQAMLADSERARQRFYIPHWDNRVTYKRCTKCLKKGQGYNCRACGQLYCEKCTVKLDVPSAFKKKNKPGRFNHVIVRF
jgi:predicted RNA-binding Zn-ribbon protein involved in translation (DUF1610 family)